MRKVWVIAKREYIAAVKTKTFVLSVLVMPFFMVGSAGVQYVLKDWVDVEDKRFAVVDHTDGQAILAHIEKAANKRNENKIFVDGKKVKPKFLIEAVPSPGTDEDALAQLRFTLSERVRKRELFGFLEIGKDVAIPVPPPPEMSETEMVKKMLLKNRLQDVNEEQAILYFSDSLTYDDFRRWVDRVVDEEVRAERCRDVNVSKDKLKEILRPVPLLSKGLSKRDDATSKIEAADDANFAAPVVVAAGLVVLMFMVIMLVAMPMMQGVVEEKMQRVAEVLLGSVTPFQLMTGKLLGGLAVSTTVAFVYLGGVYWAVWMLGFAHYLSPDILAWFVVYQTLSVLMFGSVFMAVGAACTDIKETQPLLLPVMLIICVPMFVLKNIIMEPNSTFSTWISFFPLTAPMLMLARQTVPPGIPLWQPMLAIGLVLATTIFCVYAAGRIFRVGLLMQGKGAHFGDLVRWVIHG